MKRYITFHGAPSRNDLGNPPKYDNFIIARGTFEYTPQPPQSSTKPPSKKAKAKAKTQATTSDAARASNTSASASASASVSDSMWWDAYGDGDSQLDPELLSWVQAREASLLLASE